MAERKSAGERSQSCSQDKTRYDPLEVAHALLDDTLEQLIECAKKHEKIFQEDEFFLILIIASDPLIKHVRRHKYYAYMFMPSPRPQQVVFLYNRHTQKIRRLWSLPDAKVMATISEMGYVDPKWQQTKEWCDAFYDGDFFNHIRKSYNILHLSECEFLDLIEKNSSSLERRRLKLFPPSPLILARSRLIIS